MLLRLSLALAITASLSSAAFAHANRDEILSELPTNVPAGQCFAKVKVPQEPVAPPPVVMGSQWVLSQGPPGSPGPIWCLVPTGPQLVAAPPQVEQYGWIRVLCENEITSTKVRRVQQKLHDRGYYRGRVNGRYDRATSEAVGQFQNSAHIDHGGYLSVQTMDALDRQSSYAYSDQRQSAQFQYGQQSQYAQTSQYAPPQAYPPAPQGYGYPPQVYVQQGYVQPGYASGYASGYYVGAPSSGYAVAQAQAYASAYAYSGGGRVVANVPAYASSTSAIQNGWLTWGGKTRY